MTVNGERCGLGDSRNNTNLGGEREILGTYSLPKFVKKSNNVRMKRKLKEYVANTVNGDLRWAKSRYMIEELNISQDR